MIRYQTWSITRRWWQISFDRYSNDRSTIMVTALPRIIQSCQGHPIFGLLRASVYLEPLPTYFFCILSPGWSDCTLWPSVGCIWLGSWRCGAASILDPVKKAHNTQNLLCHYPQTLSKRFSMCCDWLRVGHKREFYATRSISVCFSSVDCMTTNHFQSTFKTQSRRTHL